MFCPKCGANNEDGATVCSFCRTQLVQSAPVEQPKYGQPGNTYSQSTNAYSQPGNGFGQPGNTYSQSTNAYSQPGNGFGQPTNAYSQPANAYSQPMNAYGQPGNGFGQPTNAYSQPGNGFGQPTNAYSQPMNAYGQPMNAYAQPQPMAYGAKMSKGEFYVHPINAQVHKNVKVNAILLYIVVGFTFLVNLGLVAQASSIPGIIGMKLFISDTIVSIGEYVAILIGFSVIETVLALISHLKLNFVCAILLAVTMFVFALVVGFSVGTVIWVGCAISQSIQLYKLNSKYSTYLRTGMIG